MAQYYPLFLNIENRPCLVVGAGEVAARKAARLVECGARVTVVGRSIAPELARMRDEGLIIHIDEDYRSEHMEEAFIVIGATDDSEVNMTVHRDAQSGGRLVNIVDCPELCNFILPALLRKGDLTVAVSTGGRSPALARKIRESLESGLDDGYGRLLRVMGELRPRILAQGKSSEHNRAVFESLVDSPLLGLLNECRWVEAEELILGLTGEKVKLEELLSLEKPENAVAGNS